MTTGHSVQQVLQTRQKKAAASKGREKLSLVISGGGMSGIYSAGVVAAFQLYGNVAAFDEIVATSAGAFSAVFLMAGQGDVAATVYTEHLLDRRFIDKKQLLTLLGYRLGLRQTFRPAMNVEYLLRTIMPTGPAALDMEKLAQCPVPLRVMACNAETGAHHTLAVTRDNVEMALRITSNIPGVMGLPVSWQGRPLVDGGLVSSFAVAHTLKGQATHVLLVSNHQPEHIAEQTSALARWMVKPMGGSLAKTLQGRAKQHQDEWRVMQAHPKGAILSAAQAIARDEQKPQRLWASACQGFQDACQLLGVGIQPYPARWQASPSWRSAD